MSEKKKAEQPWKQSFREVPIEDGFFVKYPKSFYDAVVRAFPKSKMMQKSIINGTDEVGDLISDQISRRKEKGLNAQIVADYLEKGRSKQLLARAKKEIAELETMSRLHDRWWDIWNHQYDRFWDRKNKLRKKQRANPFDNPIQRAFRSEGIEIVRVKTSKEVRR